MAKKKFLMEGLLDGAMKLSGNVANTGAKLSNSASSYSHIKYKKHKKY